MSFTCGTSSNCPRKRKKINLQPAASAKSVCLDNKHCEPKRENNLLFERRGIQIKNGSYEESLEYCTPSERIASNYSPSARKLKINTLRQPKPNKQFWQPVDSEGNLMYPPPTKDEAKLKSLKPTDHKKQKIVANTVSLRDLLTGEYTRKQEELRQKRLEKIKTLKQKKFEEEQKKAKEYQKLIELKQDPLPVHPDVQRKILLDEVENEQKLIVSPEDLKKIKQYIEDIDVSRIEPFPNEYLEQILKLIPLRLRRHWEFKFFYEKFKTDLFNNYEQTMKKLIFEYNMKDSEERKRLNIQNLPKEWPPVIIRAPIVWHTNFVISKNFINHNLFICNAVNLMVRKLWQGKYNLMYIIDMEEMNRGEKRFPLTAKDFTEKVNSCAEHSRYILEKDWLPSVADILAQMTQFWDYMVPLRQREDTAIVERFFRSIGSLMSKELRELVMRSINHLKDFLLKYNIGNDFNVYEYLKYPNLPIISTQIVPLDGTTTLIFSPTLDEIRQVLYNMFVKIIEVNQKIPRLEKIMFPEFADREDLYLHSVKIDETEVYELIIAAIQVLDVNRPGPQKYLNYFDEYSYIFNGEAQNELDEFFKRKPFPHLKDFGRRIQLYDTKMDELFVLPIEIPLNLIMADCSIVNRALYNIIYGLKQQILNYFIEQNRKNNNSICETFTHIADTINKSPNTTAELVELINFLQESRDITLFDLKAKISTITVPIVLFLMTYAILDPDDVRLNARTFLWPSDLEDIIEMANTRLTERKEIIEGNLKHRRIAFEVRVKENAAAFELFKKRDPPVLGLEEMIPIVEELDDLLKRIREDKVEGDQINEEEALLDLEVSPMVLLNWLVTSIDPFDKLWHTALDFTQKYEIWFHQPYLNFNAEEIAEEVDIMWKTLYKIRKLLSDCPGAKRVAEVMRGRVEKFRTYVPILGVVCTKGLRERHWEQISEVVGIKLEPKPDQTLAQMVEYGLAKYIPTLEEISASATKEYELEQNLIKMQTEWKDVVFVLSPYRDSGTYILQSLDDIQQLLDDHILKAQTMRGSPYVKAIEAEMTRWEEKLISMQDILDAWMKCQTTWMYLEPIFNSEDIMRQMPNEAGAFKQVDQSWRYVMDSTKKDTHVLVATDMPNLLQTLRDNNTALEDVQKGLNDYLEKKRLFFPRFFFLSNDELLEILSETKDPFRVQPHLKKCFEGIYKLKFEDEDILGMVSGLGEEVTFIAQISPAEAKGMVERWLCQVESQMLKSMRVIIHNSTQNCQEAKRRDWIANWPEQVILCVELMIWTTNATKYIGNQTLPKLYDECVENIMTSVEMIREELNPIVQCTVEALIVVDVHIRDIVQELIDNNINDTKAFNWLAQLRYYWRGELGEKGNVGVAMITTEIFYGMEYLGNYTRLVATPLTDRCYRTIMSALKLNLGGAPEGPAGAGKTETCKDLAKAVGKKCVVFNCSDSLNYKALGKFFKGLAQSGSWACFDEFNRINLEVLSVVAQQILCIQLAIAQKVKRFVFEDVEIPLDPSCSVFITMYSGYIGRQELPDNLKVLFRTVAMMVPDYILIGEITLYSYGFKNAKPLSQKIVQTYKLCSEQLSSQHHYDYGLRAVKSVLSAAGTLKRTHPEHDEAEIIKRAIIDVNLPKFLAEDITLFEGIMSDLFSEINALQLKRDDFSKYLQTVLEEKNLQNTDWYRAKIEQLYEMILIRHGIMLIGETMSGKTCAYRSLAEILKLLASDKESKMQEQPVQYLIINPKAITLNQLYGSFDAITNEWSDGVLANTFRSYANSATADRKWIIFDGPVDALWIENLNTVLDDNRKLCLTSGEIIHMSNKMNMMFELEDLEQASPATVSRCGIVFFEASRLGWKPLKISYMNTLKEKLSTEQLDIFNDIIDWLVPPTLAFIKKQAVRFMETSELHLFQSFSWLFSIAMEEETQISTIYLQCITLFSFIWAFGSTFNRETRQKFDIFIRPIIYGENKDYTKPKSFKLTKNQVFPDKQNIFDWYYDKKNNGTWMNWIDVFPLESLNPKSKVSELMIQTNEWSCQKFFLQKCLQKRVPILFCGPTGTGKSALVLNHILTAPKNKFIANSINFSARISAQMTQDIIMSKLDRRRKGVYGPSMGKLCILFVDDLGMPQKEAYGAQPPIELLRQWIDHGYWFDKDTSILQLIDIVFVAAMGPPCGGTNVVASRLLRHLYICTVDTFSDATMTKIFTSILDWHFAKGFEDGVAKLAKACVNATLHVFKKVVDKFLPTPSKSHYKFSLRDFSRVIFGCTLVPPAFLKSSEKFIRLWIHETYRVFNDRLIEQKDRDTLFNIVCPTIQKHFGVRLEEVFKDLMSENEKFQEKHIRSLMFGTYGEHEADSNYYNEINSTTVKQTIQNCLNDYNKLSKTPMNLVLFQFLIEHISRVSRMLTQESGHGLLVGIGGSGRHSVVKLATHMAGYSIYIIKLSKVYGFREWREDIKKLLLQVVYEGKPTVFLFSDDQIMQESFVEDLSIILNTGDVPNLFTPEEKITVLDKIQTVAGQQGVRIDATPLAVYNFFLEKIKSLLHVMFAVSPVGETLRIRLRMYPSLINCCTIDWFTSWPKDALELVAQSYMKELDVADEIRSASVKVCQIFHTSVEEMSIKFWEEQKRRAYVTPSLYLELLETFKKLYGKKVEQLNTLKMRYIVGLEKLQFASDQIAVMSQELIELQPKLVVASENTEKLMVKIEKDTALVEKQKEIVGADEAVANEAAAAAQAIKDDCESDLAEAVPALEAALNALNTLKPADITLVKSMKNPPPAVKLVLEAVCVMKGIKPERKPDPLGSGKMIEDFWGQSTKMLGDMKFLESLKTYNKDSIPPAIMKKIREKYIPDRDFNPDTIKNVSTACEGLCKWVRAMEVYDRVIKIVEPKKIKLAEAERELAQQMEVLNAKRTQLKEVLDKLQQLNDQLAAENKNKKDLEDNIQLCSDKLVRAKELIGGLGGEKKRWSETAEYLQTTLDNVVGDVLLSAGYIAYLGPYTVDYRNELITKWNETSLNLGIPTAKKFSLVETLGEPVSIRNWNICGLPVDNYSVSNGIVVFSARKWPLMIDPQGQANKWIRNIEKDHHLVILQQNNPQFHKLMRTAIHQGHSVLLENVGEKLDATLDPILTKNVYQQRGVNYLKLGDDAVRYSANFRLYITTSLRNPHYLPEVTVKVTVINFMITPQGLQDQLLGIVVSKERLDLEEKKNELIVTSANNKKALKEIEDQILMVLSSSEGNILEDETAIKILTSSKNTSEDIQHKQKIAVATEIEIDAARNQYLPISIHSSALFFCVNNLTCMNIMYQYSLTWFINLFIMAIAKSEKSTEILKRIENLNSFFSRCIYENVCRSLFEKHKLAFSLILTVGILRLKGEIDEEHWLFFLTGGYASENPYKNPSPQWLSAKSWSECVRASTLASFETFRENIETCNEKWREYYDSPNPHEIPLPKPFENVTDILKLICLRCLRPDKIVPAVRLFIAKKMGSFYIDPPLFDLRSCFGDSTKCSPLIFILSFGSDPMAGLLKFAKDSGFSESSIHPISLGQGQGPIAENLIKKALNDGEWVVLQNCHLAESWMERLEQICNELIIPENTNEVFRLWLTSYPTDKFPISILQNGIKMVNEPPKGLKQNVLRIYQSHPITDNDFYTCDNTPNWQVLLFGLNIFHAIVQERRTFGPLGWNVPYEFNESDLKISQQQLRMFITDYAEVPFDALVYLTGECNYGGRVTDDIDRRLLLSLLKSIYNSTVITSERYSFSPSGIYRIPESLEREECITYIKSLPSETLPEVLGLHENANIVRNNQETQMLFSTILCTLTNLKSDGDQSANPEATVITLATNILSKIPQPFSIIKVENKYPLCYENSINTVLKQELIRFNILIATIRSSLESLIKAIKGLIVMSKELDETFTSLRNGKIPQIWAEKSYASLKPLGSYINDLLARLQFLQDWIDQGVPTVFWISGFYFTQGFLTSVLQNFARKMHIPIDSLDFMFLITRYDDSTAIGPPTGTYNKMLLNEEGDLIEPKDVLETDPNSVHIKGLFLEGARWDKQLHQLSESFPKILFDKLPVICMKPELKANIITKGVYACPTYNTSVRRGALSSTGLSTNFVMFIGLKSNIGEDHWIQRGVASLCQLDD